jgi:hypothetical protein
MAFSPYIDGH